MFTIYVNSDIIYLQSFRFPFYEAPLEILEEINYLEEIIMNFVEEFKTDRERNECELYELYDSSQDVQTDIRLILEDIVFKEFRNLHKCDPYATHLRVTFHLDINGVLSYNTRTSGEYTYKDPVATNLIGKDKRIMSLVVMLIKKGNIKEFMPDICLEGISAREEYDTDTERTVYTFEFFY